MVVSTKGMKRRMISCVPFRLPLSASTLSLAAPKPQRWGSRSQQICRRRVAGGDDRRRVAGEAMGGGDDRRRVADGDGRRRVAIDRPCRLGPLLSALVVPRQHAPPKPAHTRTNSIAETRPNLTPSRHFPARRHCRGSWGFACCCGNLSLREKLGKGLRVGAITKKRRNLRHMLGRSAAWPAYHACCSPHGAGPLVACSHSLRVDSQAPMRWPTLWCELG